MICAERGNLVYTAIAWLHRLSKRNKDKVQGNVASALALVQSRVNFAHIMLVWHLCQEIKN